MRNPPGSPVNLLLPGGMRGRGDPGRRAGERSAPGSWMRLRTQQASLSGETVSCPQVTQAHRTWWTSSQNEVTCPRHTLLPQALTVMLGVSWGVTGPPTRLSWQPSLIELPPGPLVKSHVPAGQRPQQCTQGSPQAPGSLVVGPGVGAELALQCSSMQGCQAHFHRGPHQPRGCLQRAKCNFRTV